MHLFLAVTGTAILLAALVDVVWTTIGTHGGGPLSKRLNAAIWHHALELHRSRRHHRGLSFVGPIIVVVTVTFWVGLIWLGWVVLFSSVPGALRDPHSGVPADLSGRIFFVAYTISSMGNGDFQPVGALWRFLTGVATLSGVGSITLGITFILEVLSAVVHKRTLGAAISGLGDTSEKIIERAWNGRRFDDALEQQLIELTAMLHLFSEQHLAYPVIHYFHSETKRTAAALRIVTLHDVLVLVSRGLPKELRPARIVTEPLRDAVQGLSLILREDFISPEEFTPDPPSLQTLRRLQIPTVSEEEFAVSLKQEAEVRRFLLGMVKHDGWSWSQAESREK